MERGDPMVQLSFTETRIMSEILCNDFRRRPSERHSLASLLQIEIVNRDFATKVAHDVVPTIDAGKY